MNKPGFDHASIRQAIAGPGGDTRGWISNGTVDVDTPDARSVRFVDDQGVALTSGPLINVTLQPSGSQVACRVANWVAGIGESSWFPFQAKDEVIVCIPDGDEMAGPIILGRLNQDIDKFPTVVAGMDPTKNNFAFIRMRPPLAIESAEAVLISNAKTKAQLAITGEGNTLLTDGSKNHLFMTSDVIALETGDKATFLQLHVADKRAVIKAGGASLQISDSFISNSFLLVPGTFNIGTSGAAGRGHGVTADQLFATLANLLCGMGLLGFFPTPGGAAPSSALANAAAWPGLNPTLISTLLASVYGAQTTTAPIGALGVPGGSLVNLTAALAAFQTALVSPVPINDPTGLVPGVGVPGLIY